MIDQKCIRNDVSYIIKLGVYPLTGVPVALLPCISHATAPNSVIAQSKNWQKLKTLKVCGIQTGLAQQCFAYLLGYQFGTFCENLKVIGPKLLE